MRVFLAGQSGRLGGVVKQKLLERGDEIVNTRFNCMIFAHRYRGEPSYEKEMYANLQWVAECVTEAKWAGEDRAVVLVGSACQDEPAMNQSLAYNLSKAALPQLARWFWSSRRIRTNVVAPRTFTGEAAACSIRQVADVILHLASKQSANLRVIKI